MSGEGDQAKGRVKQAVGDLTDDKDLKREGKVDEAAGKVKEGVDKALPNLDWSWVHNKAAFSFQLEDRPDWYLDLHLTAVDYVLKEVGPQSLTILLNGKEISKKTLDKKGAVFLHFPVSAGPKPEVALNIDPCEVNAEGTHFCVLLHSIGFSREIK